MTAAQEELELRNEDAGIKTGSFISRLWRYVLALFLFVSPVFAALPEIPANGLDDDSSGGDALFAGADADNDGYEADEECDDADYKTVPGEYYPCDAGGGANTGYRLCGVGSWGSCTSNASPLCEATGGGTCYYISFASGNDTTGDGSYANPWKTLRCVGYWSSGAPGCNVDPAPGSVVYLKDGGTYSDSYTQGNGLAALSINSTRSGSADHPNTLKRYPGATVIIAGVGTSPTEGYTIYGINVDHWTIEDIEIDGGYGLGVRFNGGSYIHVKRNYFHDIEGINNNNNSAIYINGATHSQSKWNTIIDISDSSEAVDFSNTTGIVIFNDDTGGDHDIAYNRIGWSTACDAGGAVHGAAIKFKHGADKDSHGGNRVYGNIIWHACEFAFGVFTGGVEVNNNLVIDSEWGFQMTSDADSYFQGWNFHHNTFYRTIFGVIVSQGDGSNPFESWNFHHNIHIDDAAYPGDVAGIRIDYYGSDAQRTATLAAAAMDYNCYWNETTSGYKWSEFGASEGGHGPAGPAGTSTTSLAAWQAVNSFDANSFVEDPELDSSFRATTDNCVDKGWRIVEAEEVSRMSTIFLGR